MKGEIATLLFVMMAFCVSTAHAEEDFPFELLIPILAQSACTESKLQNCNNAESCMYSKGYWYNGKCNVTRYNGTDKYYIIYRNNLVNYSPSHNIKYTGNIKGTFQTRYTIFGDYVCVNSLVDVGGSGGMYINNSPYSDESLPPLVEQTNILNIGSFTSSVDFGLSQNGDGTKVLHYTSEDDYFINYPHGVIINKSPYFIGSTWNYFYKSSSGFVDIKGSYKVLSKEIISKFRLLRSQIDYGIFYPVQYAAIAALIGPDDFIEEQRRQYASRNKTLCGGLRRIGWDVRDSQGTMFVWAKIPEGYASSVDFCMKLMERTGVIVTPGSAFGSNGEGYVRMALVVNESVIEEIVDVLDASGIFKKNSIKESDI